MNKKPEVTPQSVVDTCKEFEKEIESLIKKAKKIKAAYKKNYNLHKGMEREFICQEVKLDEIWNYYLDIKTHVKQKIERAYGIF